MGLSSELTAQFVEVINTKTDVKNETVVYGTVLDYNGTTGVQIDGSDLFTPVTTTSAVKIGDRVMVMIKNHTATITGNISTPSASSSDVDALETQVADFEMIVADKISTSQLEAEKATIHKLIANKVEVSEFTAKNAEVENLLADKLDVNTANITYAKVDDLNATNAKINNLGATYATIEKLNAANAEIDKLEADKLSADEAKLKYAEIAELNAVDAKVGNLTADVAEIDTLIFGSAAGDTISANFANAVIAQLGNAQIKSAMIDSVSASKITAGDVITNNVRVMSEDGKLVISDETMQISDQNGVIRVQIGKDAAGDYSISVCDAEGNVMFSKGGITDAAIKDKIIRNDMVSDNANIDAAKLDISSLFTVINDETGSETINASKVFIDGQQQTLEVSFKSMTDSVTEQGKTISSQGTQLQEIQGKITSKVWQQDIETSANGLDTKFSNKYSSLEQTVGGLSSTVSANKTELQNAINDITIGGRNLIADSATSIETTSPEDVDYHFITYIPTVLPLEDGSPYSVSADVEVLIGNISEISVKLYNDDFSTQYADITLPIVDGRIEGVFDSVSGSATRLLVYAGVAGTTSGNSIRVSNIKFEKGNKPTDWTPAPEDMETRMSSAESRIEQNEKDITLKVSQKEFNDTLEYYYTFEEVDNEINLSREGVELSVKNIKVGGRNLIADSTTSIETTSPADYGYQYITYIPVVLPLEDGAPYSMSADIEVLAGDISAISVKLYSEDTQTQYAEILPMIENGHIEGTFESVNGNAAKLLVYAGVAGSTNGNSIRVSNIKFEKGNKATDWTPAPEDVTDDIKEVNNNLSTRVEETETNIKLLKDSISTLVTDGNGESLMTQTPTGWVFSTKTIQETVEATSSELDNLSKSFDTTDALVDELGKTVNDINARTRYVNVGEYDNNGTIEACIELGDSETDYKLLICQTQILFKVGSDVPTRIDIDGLVTDNITVENELRQINNNVSGRYVSAVRNNGNCGFQWKGDDA